MSPLTMMIIIIVKCCEFQLFLFSSCLVVVMLVITVCFLKQAVTGETPQRLFLAIPYRHIYVLQMSFNFFYFFSCFFLLRLENDYFITEIFYQSEKYAIQE